MPYIETEPGVQIYYRELGNAQGRPVVVVHGWTLNHQTWDRQIQDFQMDYRIIAIDLRGHGDSDKPTGDYSVDRLASDVAGVINGLDLHNVTLIGWSFGGTTSIRVGSTHNERLAQLVLVNAAGPKYTASDDCSYGHDKETIEEWLNQERDDLETWRAGVMSSMPKNPYTDTRLAWLTQQSLRTPSWAAAPMLAACCAADLREDLPKIPVPTLICHGLSDVFCAIEGAEMLEAGIPDATLVRFEESGHSPQLEQPELFNKTVLAFLADA